MKNYFYKYDENAINDFKNVESTFKFMDSQWKTDSWEIERSVDEPDKLTLNGYLICHPKYENKPYYDKKVDIRFIDDYNLMNIIASGYRPKPKPLVPGIKKVIFNDPATIVFWEDNTKTVVMKQDEDKRKKFDPEKGLAMAIAKKALGNEGRYFEIFKNWID